MRKNERKKGRINPSDPSQLYRAMIKECSSFSLLRSSVPNSMNAIFFHKWASLWTATCWGHFCFYWQTYSRGTKVHHSADVYLSTTGGIGRGPMERECFKRGRQTFSLGRSRRCLRKNVSGAFQLQPGTGSGLGASLTSSQVPVITSIDHILHVACQHPSYNASLVRHFLRLFMSWSDLAFFPSLPS